MRNAVARRPLDGLLLLDKPTGMTSNGALQRVKWLYQARKLTDALSAELPRQVEDSAPL